MSAQLAVAIVSWNVEELLDRCLLSLREEIARASTETEVWVVDSASSDGTVPMTRNRHPWVHLVASEENLGYVRGNNYVLNHLLQADEMPDYVWLLNPDTEIRSGAISTLVEFLADHPRAGLIGPQLLNADGSLQPGGFHFPGLFQPLCDLGLLPGRFYDSHLNGRYPAALYAAGRPFRIDHPLGAAMMARGSALRQVGLLDERFFMYCEEIDWAWRMRKAGWEAWMVPEASVTHYGGASTGQARPATTAHLWESRAQLYRKHHGALTRKLVAAAVRRVFSRKEPESAEWATAYERILTAWAGEDQ